MYCCRLVIKLIATGIVLLLYCEHIKAVAWKNSNQRLLQTMKSYMNFGVDPCLDFYQFACGNWENLLPQKANYLDTIGRLEYENNRQLKQILEEKLFISRTDMDEIYQKVVTYYETCRDQQTFAAEEYLRIIKPTEDDDWPAVQEVWLPQKPWNIFSTLARLQNIGFNGFLLTLEIKNLNATYYQLQLDKLQDLGLTTYEQTLLDVMDNSSSKKSRLVAQNIQNFLKHAAVLAKNHQSNYATEMTLEELQMQVTNINFKNFFSFIMGTERLSDFRLKVANLVYFRKLADLVQKTSPDTLIQMLKLKLLGYLNKQMPQNSSGLQCLQHMRELVPLALDLIYEQEVYKYEREANDFVIQKLFQKLQKKFVSIIKEHLPELSGQEQQFLKDKILHMKLNIGNLPVTDNEEQFYSEYFASWQVYADFFYWNHLNALQHKYSEKFNLLSLHWSAPQHTYFHWPYGSPAYQPSSNLLIIPHTYLQYPIFQNDFHEIFLYAELGNTLGHEMLHAFDTNGLQYDSQGNPSTLFINNLPDKKHFMRSLECLNKQKPSSLNEKIADISGFRLAYDAYFEWPLKPSVRGASSFTGRQLFFIKFAQFFCAVNPKRIQYDDTHDTPFLRVPQVVKNHAHFETVFQCEHHQQNDRKQQEKCNMW